MHYRALYAFHLIYFIIYAATTFLPKYFGELGLTDGQIGMLMSLPAMAGVLMQPLFGAMTDRVRQKRFVVIGLLAGLAAVSFAMDRITGFLWLLGGMTAFNILQLPIAPASTAIALEYTAQTGKGYGPIRLLGTVGYQIGALGIGLVLAGSLKGLYRVIGLIVLAACAAACFLPPVAGHQHGQKKVSMAVLLRNRHIVALLGMVLIGTVTTQFYMSFFSKHLGDLGIGNTMTGVMLFISVAMEIPFLIFGDRLARRFSIWQCLMAGLILCAIRWLGLAFAKSPGLILIFQIPGVSVMACFEFFPALYINRRVPDTLKGSAQTAVMIVSFGIAKAIGSLLGGFVSDRIGIPAVFAANGIILIIAIIILWRPAGRLMAEENNAPCA